MNENSRGNRSQEPISDELLTLCDTFLVKSRVKDKAAMDQVWGRIQMLWYERRMEGDYLPMPSEKLVPDEIILKRELDPFEVIGWVGAIARELRGRVSQRYVGN